MIGLIQVHITHVLTMLGGFLAPGGPFIITLGIEIRRAQPIGREFPTRTLSVRAAGS
jgi:hypothetical protein